MGWICKRKHRKGIQNGYAIYKAGVLGVIIAVG